MLLYYVLLLIYLINFTSLNFPFQQEDGFDDIKTLDEYREKRLRDLKIMQALNRFGSVYEITKDEWIREVTECSHTCHVIVHLYQDYIEDCRLMEETLQISKCIYRSIYIADLILSRFGFLCLYFNKHLSYYY